MSIQRFLESYGVRWKGLEELTKEEKDSGTELHPDTENFNVNQLIKDIDANQYEPKFRHYIPKEISIQTIANRVSELNEILLKENKN